jgi:hypothetical protein
MKKTSTSILCYLSPISRWSIPPTNSLSLSLSPLPSLPENKKEKREIGHDHHVPISLLDWIQRGKEIWSISILN